MVAVERPRFVRRWGVFAIVLSAAVTLSGLPVESACRDLGHAKFRRREAASAALLRAGPATWPVLERLARKSPDPEVRRRAADLLPPFSLWRQRLTFAYYLCWPAGVAEESELAALWEALEDGRHSHLLDWAEGVGLIEPGDWLRSRGAMSPAQGEIAYELLRLRGKLREKK